MFRFFFTSLLTHDANACLLCTQKNFRYHELISCQLSCEIGTIVSAAWMPWKLLSPHGNIQADLELSFFCLRIFGFGCGKPLHFTLKRMFNPAKVPSFIPAASIPTLLLTQMAFALKLLTHLTDFKSFSTITVNIRNSSRQQPVPHVLNPIIHEPLPIAKFTLHHL